LVQLTLCGVGFLRGSRAAFLYSAASLVAGVWAFSARRQALRRYRFAAVVALGVAVAGVWLLMSEWRGADVRERRLSETRLDVGAAAAGAFDIYSATAFIVQCVPATLPYQYHRPLVPLVLGWVPRSLWSSKPYPYSNTFNYLEGDTLESRSASIAVGVVGEGWGSGGFIGAFLYGCLFAAGGRWFVRLLRRHLGLRNPVRLLTSAAGAVWMAMLVRGGVPEMFYMGLFIVPMYGLAGYLVRREP
ncbi:MAG: hypothetical protein L6R30_26275, partial [Thermoanaerobaculia bacterium]|nr:hypothetical protein [Thermoanaerobaculia bacterium]